MTKTKRGAPAQSSSPSTKTSKTHAGRQRDQPSSLAAADREHVDQLLDKALEDTFPASDPIAIGGDRLHGSIASIAPSKRR
jgi:hypothetical protein